MRVLILHGVNVWNTGDLGLLQTMARRLREELGTDIELCSEDVFSRTGPGLGEELKRLDLRTSPPLVPLRFERGWSRTRWLFHVATTALAVLAVRLFGPRLLNVLPDTLGSPIRALLSADVVISKAGGHLYSTAERRVASPTYLFTIWAASFLGRPTIVYAQSVGPFSTVLADFVARVALRRVRLATAREPLSYRWLRRRLPARTLVQLTADEAFLLEPGAREPRDPDEPELGITAISWHFPGHPDPTAAAARYESALVDAARWYIDERKGSVRLIRWLVGGHREGDEAVLNRLVKAIDRPARTSVIGPFAPDEACARLGGMEMLVGSRLHSAIFAMVVGTPAVAIEYLPKTSAIMAMAVGDGWTIPIEEVDQGRLVEKVKRLYEQRQTLADRLARAVPALQSHARENAVLVRSTLRAR